MAAAAAAAVVVIITIIIVIIRHIIYVYAMRYNNANTKQCDCIVRREARIIDWSLENSGGNSNVIELGFIECIHLRWCHGPPATTTTDQNFSASAAEKINVKTKLLIQD